MAQYSRPLPQPQQSCRGSEVTVSALLKLSRAFSFSLKHLRQAAKSRRMSTCHPNISAIDHGKVKVLQ